MSFKTEVPAGEQPSMPAQIVLPVIQEQLEISRRVVETGTVRLQKHVEQHLETVSVPLTQVRWQVERVSLGHVVASPPDVRHEGATTIYPVVEERLVVTRELVLKEEVRVTQVVETRTDTSTHTVTRESVEEERVPASSPAAQR